jgi:hypothetical protein
MAGCMASCVVCAGSNHPAAVVIVIGSSVVVGAEGVETDRDLLVSPLPVRAGQHVARVAVHPGEAGHVNGDAGFLGDFADHRNSSRA